MRFNLRLTDPVERYLDDASPWCGIAGDYVVTLGRSSAAEPGTDASLATLQASVNALSRIWYGVRPATGLAVTDDLSGPAELLAQLDAAFLLPRPARDCYF